MDVAALQAQISATFGERDRTRGIDGTFRRLVEEVGELAKAIRASDTRVLEVELSDVIAWTASVAVLCGVDLQRALGRYGRGCPKCAASPCRCPVDSPAR